MPCLRHLNRYSQLDRPVLWLDKQLSKDKTQIMIPAERQKTILNLLNDEEVLSINALTEALQVSHMTIRRDIAKLEQEGKVKSVSGGIQLTEVLLTEPSHALKMNQDRQEKAEIGRFCAGLIHDCSTIYLDAGTTTLEIARQLKGRDDLVIVTNDFAIAVYLAENTTCSLYHTGGKVDPANQSCIGPKATAMLNNFNIDIAFISTSSWNLKGISTPYEDKVPVKRAVSEAARLVYLVSDSSKYGKVATFHALGLEQFDKVITDYKLSDACVSELTEKGIDVVVAARPKVVLSARAEQTLHA